jgi:putative transposase
MTRKFAPPRTESKLTDRSALDSTTDLLTEQFALTADGYICETADVWQVVVAAAARRSTIEATSHHLAQAPDSNTIRSYLNGAFTTAEIPALQTASNAALASQIPIWLTTRAQEIACDLHDEPYYGKVQPVDPEHPEADPDYWICRGEARAGTTYFYRCASAYVMRRGVRLTLAVNFVHPGETLADVLKWLLKRVTALHLTLRRLFLDKGFCSIPVIRDCLMQVFPKLPVILACPIRGKREGRGTRALCQGRRSYRTTHTFVNAEYGELTVSLGVVKTFSKRRNGTRNVVWLIYVLLNLPDEPLRNVRKLYRRRFGIESSYRLLEQVRIRTSSNNPAVRFLYMAVALLLASIWIALHWIYLRVRGSGPRRVASQYFRLDGLRSFLLHAVESIYGVVTVLEPPSIVKPVNY